MDEQGIKITDPNYRDIATRQTHERADRERTEKKIGTRCGPRRTLAERTVVN
jgi:hypothetical protein